jgi:hypothetical protein
MGEVDIRRKWKGWMEDIRMVVRGQRWLDRDNDG